MTSRKLKLGIPLTVATVVYILLSLFGSTLYLALPSVLCSIGARIQAYTLILFAIREELTLDAILWISLSHLFVLAMLLCGVLAIITGKSRLFGLLVLLENLVTLIFLAFRKNGEFSSTSGIVVNLAYSLWLLRHVPAAANKHKAKKGK